MITTRRRRASALLLLVLIVTGCSGGRDVPDDYGATTERNFTEGCITSLTDPEEEGPSYDDDSARDVCGCAYEEITSPSGLSYERFQEINDAQEDAPTRLPADLRGLVERCASAEPADAGGDR